MISEFSLQIKIIRALHNHPILSEYVLHIPNGGYRHAKEASKLRAMGVRKGVSDLFLPYPNILYHGMWQEVKLPRADVSEEQKEWIFKMRKSGYAAEVVKSVEESIDIFISYLQNSYKPIWNSSLI